MSLNDIKDRPWQIQACSALSGEGLSVWFIHYISLVSQWNIYLKNTFLQFSTAINYFVIYFRMVLIGSERTSNSKTLLHILLSFSNALFLSNTCCKAEQHLKAWDKRINLYRSCLQIFANEKSVGTYYYFQNTNLENYYLYCTFM